MPLEGVVTDYRDIKKGKGNEAFYDLYEVPLPGEGQKTPTPEDLESAKKVAVLRVLTVRRPPKKGMKSGSITAKRYPSDYEPFNPTAEKQYPDEGTIELPELGIGIAAIPPPNPSSTYRLVPYQKPPEPPPEEF